VRGRLCWAIASGFTFALLCQGSALAAWHQPVGGPSPINEAAGQSANNPSLTTIGGVPYVAWDEAGQIRVARLNTAGTAWEKVADSASPINEAANQGAEFPSLTGINGVPYVAWTETDGSLVKQIRVARLNAAGTAWEKVADTPAASPINWSNIRNAFSPSITGINGVPYVAWTENDSASHGQVHVARLNAAGTAWEKVVATASPINSSSAHNAAQADLTSIGGVPYVAWTESDGAHNQIRVARLNAAGTAWERLADSSSPINKAGNQDAFSPSLTSIGGTPYVAWEEYDGTNNEIRVARLNAAGTAWERVADSPSPINRSSTESGQSPSLISIDGIPYVAWFEGDGVSFQIHVARLNAAGSAWEGVADGASPINEASGQVAFYPSLTAVNGVPYVAWQEFDAGGHYQLRVSRLEPEFLAQSVAPGSTTADLSATWHTYGIRFPIGFDYGPSLESSTTPELAPVGSDTATLTQQVSGLAPSSVYQFQSFATAGVSLPRLQAPHPTVFQTTAPPPPPPPPDGGADTTLPQTTITKQPKNKLDGTKAKYKFTSNEPNSTFVCKFDKANFKPCDSGKAKYKHLDDGKHKFQVIATDAAGNADPSPAKDKFKVL
jgi:hypothetical protein